MRPSAVNDLSDISGGMNGLFLSNQDIVDLIYGIMDGVVPDIASLSKELQDFAKTTNVILGKTLYSDSWLDI